MNENEQMNLLTDHAHTRNTDPWTSHAAAKSISLLKLRDSQHAVLACFLHFGAMHHNLLVSNYERLRHTRNWPMQSVSGLRTRTHELVEAGFLQNSGQVVVLPSNRKSIVWEVSE